MVEWCPPSDALALESRHWVSRAAERGALPDTPLQSALYLLRLPVHEDDGAHHRTVGDRDRRAGRARLPAYRDSWWRTAAASRSRAAHRTYSRAPDELRAHQQ